MNAIVKQDASALALPEADMLLVLQSSLYPGASIDSIRMVLAYCKAAGLDPMQKPVHIVPMWDGKVGYMRDVVMPGVNLYRTQAARTGCAGISEPDYGPDVTATIGGQEITYPQWCRVTVKRIISPTGATADFTAREFWRENYAIKGGKEKSVAPNAMWTKRPYGQLAKCAEAQALRKAFPEIAAAATAEEMEGKPLHPDSEIVDVPAVPAELLKAARDAADIGREAFAAWWKAAAPSDRGKLRSHVDDLKARTEAAEKAKQPPADDPPPVDDDFVRDYEGAAP